MMNFTQLQSQNCQQNIVETSGTRNFRCNQPTTTDKECMILISASSNPPYNMFSPDELRLIDYKLKASFKNQNQISGWNNDLNRNKENWNNNANQNFFEKQNFGMPNTNMSNSNTGLFKPNNFGCPPFGNSINSNTLINNNIGNNNTGNISCNSFSSGLGIGNGNICTQSNQNNMNPFGLASNSTNMFNQNSSNNLSNNQPSIHSSFTLINKDNINNNGGLTRNIFGNNNIASKTQTNIFNSNPPNQIQNNNSSNFFNNNSPLFGSTNPVSDRINKTPSFFSSNNQSTSTINTLNNAQISNPSLSLLSNSNPLTCDTNQNNPLPRTNIQNNFTEGLTRSIGGNQPNLQINTISNLPNLTLPLPVKPTLNFQNASSNLNISSLSNNNTLPNLDISSKLFPKGTQENIITPTFSSHTNFSRNENNSNYYQSLTNPNINILVREENNSLNNISKNKENINNNNYNNTPFNRILETLESYSLHGYQSNPKNSYENIQECEHYYKSINQPIKIVPDSYYVDIEKEEKDFRCQNGLNCTISTKNPIYKKSTHKKIDYSLNEIERHMLKIKDTLTINQETGKWKNNLLNGLRKKKLNYNSLLKSANNLKDNKSFSERLSYGETKITNKKIGDKLNDSISSIKEEPHKHSLKKEQKLVTFSNFKCEVDSNSHDKNLSIVGKLENYINKNLFITIIETKTILDFKHLIATTLSNNFPISPIEILSSITLSISQNKLEDSITINSINEKATITISIFSDFKTALPIISNFQSNPSLEILEDFSYEALSSIDNFEIYNEYGKVTFLNSISLVNVNFDDFIQLTQQKVYFTSNDQRFDNFQNILVRIDLSNIWIKGDKLINSAKEMIEKENGVFINYDCDNGIISFKTKISS